MGDFVLNVKLELTKDQKRIHKVLFSDQLFNCFNSSEAIFTKETLSNI